MSWEMVRAAQLGAAIAVVCGAGPARGDPEPETPSRAPGFDRNNPVIVDVTAATAFPVMVLGVSGNVELPYGLLWHADVGWLGKPYTDAINAFFKAEGAYGSGAAADSAQTIVRSALRSSPVFRTGVGWRPFAAHGFEIYTGYTLVALRAELVASELVAVTGVALAADEPQVSLQMQSLLHNLDLGLGWRWVLGQHSVLRIELGYLQTLASSTKVAADTASGRLAVPQLSAALDAHLDPLYLHTISPVVSVAFGYRL